jgi:hypothetical protein
VSGPPTVLPATTVAVLLFSSVTALLRVEFSRLTGPDPVTVSGPLTVVFSSDTVPAPVAVTAARRVAPVA